MADQANFADQAMPFMSQLYAAALRMTRNPSDAEVVVQESYLRAYRGFGTFHGGTNVRAVLLGDDGSRLADWHEHRQGAWDALLGQLEAIVHHVVGVEVEASEFDDDEPEHTQRQCDGEHHADGEQAARPREGACQQRPHHLQNGVAFHGGQQHEDASSREQCGGDPMHGAEPHLATLKEGPHRSPFVGRWRLFGVHDRTLRLAPH